jgi:hypothetical protein
VDEISSWLAAVLVNEPPPPSINGLYFGLSDESVDGPKELKARCRVAPIGLVAGCDPYLWASGFSAVIRRSFHAMGFADWNDEAAAKAALGRRVAIQGGT